MSTYSKAIGQSITHGNDAVPLNGTLNDVFQVGASEWAEFKPQLLRRNSAGGSGHTFDLYIVPKNTQLGTWTNNDGFQIWTSPANVANASGGITKIDGKTLSAQGLLRQLPGGGLKLFPNEKVVASMSSDSSITVQFTYELLKYSST